VRTPQSAARYIQNWRSASIQTGAAQLPSLCTLRVFSPDPEGEHDDAACPPEV
jgi:hypothetical protein